MSSTELIEFSENFNDDVRVEAHTLQTLREEAFVLKMGEILEDYGEVENLIPVPIITWNESGRI